MSRKKPKLAKTARPRSTLLYLVTIAVYGKYRHKDVFGRIENDQMRLNRFGLIVDETLQGIACRWPHSSVDAAVIMPNHIHFLLRIKRPATTKMTPSQKRLHRANVTDVVQRFKQDSRGGIEGLRGAKTMVWQRKFHQILVSDNQAKADASELIQNNPVLWSEDYFYPKDWYKDEDGGWGKFELWDEMARQPGDLQLPAAVDSMSEGHEAGMWSDTEGTWQYDTVNDEPFWVRKDGAESYLSYPIEWPDESKSNQGKWRKR